MLFIRTVVVILFTLTFPFGDSKDARQLSDYPARAAQHNFVVLARAGYSVVGSPLLIVLFNY